MMSSRSLHFASWPFGVVIVLYAVALPWGANFGVIDDYIFLDTIFSGHALSLDTFVVPSIGRFFPLNAQEYNVISLVSSSPFAFYAYHSVQFLIAVLVMLEIIKSCCGGRYDSQRRLAYCVVLALVFSTGFVDAWYRLMPTERGQFFFFAIFLLAYLFYQREQKWMYLILGLTSANFGLYCKEPGFVMLGAFAFFHVCFGWKTLNGRQKVFDVLIIISSAVFAFIYFFFIFAKRGPVLYGDIAGPYNAIVLFARTVFNYVFSDPFLTIPLFVLLGHRAYELSMKRDRPEPLYDAALIAGAAYVLVFLKLSMWSFRYLLPAYVFSILGMMYFLVARRYFRRRSISAAIGIAAALYLLNVLPIAVHLVSFNKNVANNFQDTLVFLKEYVSQSRENVTIYLDGVEGTEVYNSLAVNLKYEGIPDGKVELRTEAADTLPLSSNGNSLNHLGDIATYSKGDELLIITPYTSKFIDQKYLNDLEGDYDLIYQARSAFQIPKVNLKTLARYVMARAGEYILSVELELGNSFMWQDFYVFRRKKSYAFVGSGA